MDMQIDTPTFIKFFEKSYVNQAENKSETIMDIIESIKEEKDAEERMKVRNVIQKYTTSEIMDAEVTAYRFKDKESETTFLEVLEDCLRTLEKFIVEKGIDSISKAADSQIVKYFKLRIMNEGKKKNISLMVENPELSSFKVYLKNLYETYGTYYSAMVAKLIFLALEGKRIMAEGSYDYVFENFWKDFGVPYQKIHNEDKMILCNAISESFRLSIHDKGNPFYLYFD